MQSPPWPEIAAWHCRNVAYEQSPEMSLVTLRAHQAALETAELGALLIIKTKIASGKIDRIVVLQYLFSKSHRSLRCSGLQRFWGKISKKVDCKKMRGAELDGKSDDVERTFVSRLRI